MIVNKIFSWPVDNPWKTIALFALFMGLMSIPSFHLQQTADVSIMVNSDLPQLVTKNEMEEIYGNSNFVIISVSDDAFSTSQLEAIENVTRQLERREEVKNATSIFTTDHIKGTLDSFEVSELVESVPNTPEELQALKRELATVPLYRGNLLSLDEQGLSIIVEFVAGTEDEVMFIVVKDVLASEERAASWVVSGLPIINTQVKHFMDADFQLLLPLFFLFIIIVLFLSFRSLRGVLVPLASIIFSILMTTGSMALMNIPLNVVTNVIPMVLIAITSSYGIHYLSHYYVENSDWGDAKTVVVKTTEHIRTIVFLSGLTTFIAFMANAYSDVRAVREFGIFVAIGVASSVVATMFLTPAILSLMRRPKVESVKENGEPERRSLIDRFLAWLADLVLIRPKFLFALCGGALLIFLVRIVDVEADYTALGYFEKNSNIVSDARDVSRNFGGINGFDIDIDSGEEEGLLKADILKTIDEFSTWVKAKYPDDIRVTLTFADYVKQMNKAYNGGNPKNYVIPDTDDEVYQYVEVYSWSGNVEEDFRNVVTADFRRARLHGRFSIRELKDGSFNESSITYINDVINDSKVWLESKLPPGVRVQPYGVLPMWKQVQVDIIEGQIYAIMIAMTAILIVVSLVFKSIIAGFIGLIPVATAVLVIFGVMGWTGIFLEIGTSLVAAMAIGIGIDDTMYFMITYQKLRAKGLDIAESMRETFQHAGKAILFTSFALVAGYAILMLSNFKVIQYFAMLNLVAIVSTTVGALILLPLLMLFAEKKLSVTFGRSKTVS
jgi:hypothetical protein